MWEKIDKELMKSLKSYKKNQQILKDNIQDIFDRIKFSVEELSNYADGRDIDRFKRKILEIKETLPKGSYILYLADRYLGLSRITNREIIEYLIMLEYFDLSTKTSDLTTFNNIVDISYQQALNECKKVKKGGKTKPLSFYQIMIATIPNHLGWLWKDYIENEINYYTNQIFNEFVVQFNLGNELNVEDDIFKRIFDKQQRSRLNMVDGKVSGAMETHIDFIANQTYVEVGKDYGMEKAKFLGINDNKQTRMCESLNNKVFYLNKWNDYDRYSAIDNKIVRYRTFGLKLGENQPPLTNHFHYCRSSLTYQVD
jgi:hypothetical protein